MKGRGGKRKRRESEKFKPEPFAQRSLPAKPQRCGKEGLFDSKELNTGKLAEYQVKMLQEEVQKMRAEQAAAARREKTLMKKKMKDNIKSSGKITSFFQRKQIAVVATAQPAEEDPDKEVSRRTIARKCNEQIQLLFQQTQNYQTQLAVLEKMNKTLLGSSGFYKTSDSAWQYIIESIQSFIADLKSKHPGRLPSHASAAKQAVCAAVSSAFPHNELINVANTLGLKRQDLVQGQQRYAQYFDEDDERNILFELRYTTVASTFRG